MDLSTRYLGLDLPNPFVVGSGPLADALEDAERLAEAGASAICMRSLFEEQLNAEAMASQRTVCCCEDSFWEAANYLPESDGFVIGPEEYLDHLRCLKQRTGLPIIASMNGHTHGGWLRYARHLAEAGADALELNFYHVATRPEETSATLEDGAVTMVKAVRDIVDLPFAVKLSPFYTALPNLTKRLEDAGADGFVLFNRYYEPDIDVEHLEHRSRMTLSTSEEVHLRLRWLAILSAQVKGSLAVSGGVHTPLDAIKAVMCGAHAVELVSTLIQNGPSHLAHLVAETASWLEHHGYDSLAQMRGNMNIERCPDPTAVARANYLYRLNEFRAFQA